jgi:hypothetical protein
MVKWTKELILEQLNRSPKSVASALVYLWKKTTEDELKDQEGRAYEGVGFTRADSPFLVSVAEQAVWRQREIERGERDKDCPLLSDRQLELARIKLPKYWAQLLQVANERHPQKASKAAADYGFAAAPVHPCCSRCGQEAHCRYGDIVFCGRCLRDYERERTQEPYELNSVERERLREELLLLKSNPVAERRETESLVIEGTRVRFKTAQEFAAQYSNNRHGLPEGMNAALNALGTKRSSEMVSFDELDDPFVLIGTG